MKVQSVMIQAFERGGIKPWSRYIEYLIRAKEYSGATDLDRFIDVYRDTCDMHHNGGHHPMKTPEELCQMSNTPPGVVMGHIARQLWEVATPEGNVLQAMNHVDIIRTWVDQAKKPEGFRDRFEFLKTNGVIPIPSSQTVHLHKHFAAPQTIEGQRPGTVPTFEQDLEEDLPPLLPAKKHEST
jgi:hypothetical protein